MAYFECTTGIGAGGGATITVTYGSSFYDLPMTCTNGTKTYTKTTTSEGVTTFRVSDEGTWTITCNGVSNTVEVVLNYTNEMHITKTFTIRSGKSDTVSFTDYSGSKTCTTNSTNGSGTVDITFAPGQEITFTSAVARDYNNVSQRYSKTITLTDDTPTTLWIMPTEDGSNMIYWYGVILWSNLSTSIPYYYQSSAPPAASFNTNHILFTLNGNYQARVVCPSVDSGSNNIYAELYVLQSKPSDWQTNHDLALRYNMIRNLNGLESVDVSDFSRNAGFSFGAQHAGAVTTTDTVRIYGVWLE